jgi:outer membrane protein TolC
MPCPGPLLAAAVLACALALGGCARQAYTPRPLDRDAALAAYQSRRTDDPGLQQYMRAHGRADSDWPLREWGLDDLTLLAFYYRSELQAARAQAQVARVQVEAARQRSPVVVTPIVQHHSAPGTQDTPWSLGFELGIPLLAGAQRSALIERAEYEAEAAALRAGAVAWSVRSEVRTRLLELHAAQARSAGLEAELGQQRAAQALLERRLAAGYASVSDVDAARLRVAQSAAEVGTAQTALQQARGGLAAALGLPLAAARDLPLSFAAFDTLPEPPEQTAVQRAALVNRIDLRASLLDFAASDAAVKLEIARQYPAIVLRPGYLWDQGDNVWSLALDLALPAGLTHGPAIRAAEGAREVAAQQALARQEAVIGEAAAHAETYARARESAQSAQAASRTQLARRAQLQKQFDVGQADRLELTLARSEALLVERRSLEARVEALRHLGALEDALQAPLAGGPLPAVPDRTAASR